MKNLKGACMFGQSGGPTSVINSSAAGVFTEALKQGNITAVYGLEHGIVGLLNEKFFDMSKEDPKEIELLKYTPSSALGSVRYKLKDASVDDTDYKRILEVFKKYDVRYFFYNGGNDSMDTCNKISKYLQSVGYECNVIGVPKTIDNDLFGTDHCPGYASAAKYIATTIMEVNLDAKVYDTPMVCIIEAMGRHAGWLTASAALAAVNGLGADLIYLPETDFDVDKFVDDVKAVCKRNGNKCIAVVSEGIHDKNGTLICESVGAAAARDSFGHAQLAALRQSLQTSSKRKPASRQEESSSALCNVAAHTLRPKTTSKKRSTQARLQSRAHARAKPTRWSSSREIPTKTATTFAPTCLCLSNLPQTPKRKCLRSG